MAESVPLNPEPLIRPHMPELDTLRGIAVSLVVCFHAFGLTYGVTGLSGVPRVLVAFTMSGWVGVNLFFVLSGFLITGILLDTKSRPDYYRRFYLRRALRILPLYYAVLLLLFVLARSGLVQRHVSWSFLALSGVYLANMASLLGVPMQYGVLWSLAVEEHFYLLWPAAVRCLSRRRIMICAALIVATCIMLRMFYFLHGLAVVGYTWLSADGLAMGAALATITRGASGSRAGVRRFTLYVFAASAALFVGGSPVGILSSRYSWPNAARDGTRPVLSCSLGIYPLAGDVAAAIAGKYPSISVSWAD